jgi:hypothetical protein
MRGVLSLLVLVFQSAVGLYGQGLSNSTNHTLGYSLGFVQAKEENLVPKVHSGAMHSLTYSMEMMNDVYHCLEFQLGYGSLSTAIDQDAGSMNAQLMLGYSCNFKMYERNTLTYCLGPKISYTSSLSEYQTWDEAHAYWGTSLSLGASSVVFVELESNQSLVMHLDLSLLGFSARPDQHRLYSNEHWTFSNIMTIMNRDYRFGVWNNTFQLKASAEYRTPVAGSSTLVLFSSLYYSRLKADAGNPLREIISRIGIGVGL